MFARTERLMLRPAWREDAAMIAALASSERKVRDIFGSEGTCSLADPCALDSCRHPEALPRLLVMKRTSAAPELIGMAGLARNRAGEVELLCWIARPHRGRGYGTEAARALLHIAEHGLRLGRVSAPYSGRAGTFPQRLGFDGTALAFRAGGIGEGIEAAAA